MLKNNFEKCKNYFAEKYGLGLDNPITIIFLGHALIFLFAIPYFDKFGIDSLLKMILVVFGNLAIFSIPFFINFEKMLKLDKLNLKLVSGILFGLSMFFGIFILSANILNSIIFSGLIFLILHVFMKYYYSEKISKIMFSIGVISFFAMILIHGTVPITDYTVRMAISNDPLRLISSGALIFASLFNFGYFLVSFAILAVTGYKANVLVLIVAYLLYNYKKNKIGAKKIFLVGIFTILFLGIMAKSILSSSGQSWSLNFLEILSYRAYFDLMTLEKIILYPAALYGKIAFTPGGESLIGEIIHGYRHNITSTMFGPIYLDLGYYSLIFSLIFGIISKLIYKKSDTKIYSIYGAVLLSMCEIGINYGFLVTMLTFLYVSENLQKKP
ncbi:oligosaccharide repeat unit polymerase family protein [Methanococcus maripaludis]|uniref:Oligosaccharide repeat unit polymerase n=2 Tax=Methanococcus maripaludis TaxID=39152 RepID=A6VG55_METM7|nr:oligosaccharide repeat unit polymerase family protein [Methanococcus maripaludis]MBA2862140.1 putative membrane protein [Methanococcus maripaludis]